MIYGPVVLYGLGALVGIRLSVIVHLLFVLDNLHLEADPSYTIVYRGLWGRSGQKNVTDHLHIVDGR